MKRAALLAFVLTALTAACAFAAPANLVLKARHRSAVAGKKAAGELRFGACGTFALGGKLVNNRYPTVWISVHSTRGDGGGCGEGGPGISATVNTIRLTSAGAFIVIGHVIYETGSADPKHCVWEISELAGTFAIPGPTRSMNLSGTGTLDATHSDAGCPTQETFSGVQASIGKLGAREPYAAETQ
jgi:hypothetical protein